MDNARLLHTQGRMARSPARTGRAVVQKHSTGSAPKLANSPILRHEELAIEGRQKTLTGPLNPPPSAPLKGARRSLSPVRSIGMSSVRQSGSPERRLRIQELEARLQKAPSALPSDLIQTSTDKRSREGDARINTPDYASSPEKSPKKARFAQYESDRTTGTTTSTDSSQTLSQTLERISNTLTATAVALRDVKETQRTILAEISSLKTAVAALQKQPSTQR
ncbi:hypothetical protein JCM33374_g382 [Metschnikowia sp. JCM 33374]|nr:hypothetical protein JCM33374_g382 [Metschnikowia sp. JCM 33374]